VEPDGYINLPQAPGLGYELVWDYINDNRVAADHDPVAAAVT